MQIKINKLPESLIEIEGDIEWADFQMHRAKAIKNLGQNLELPGFRKGHVPENMLLKNISEIAILQEMAELAMPGIYMDILEKNKIDAIGRPEIGITKLASGNPLGFKIKTAMLPEFKLPDYKALAGKVNYDKPVKAEVSEEEIEKTISQIRKMRSTHAGHDHEVKNEELPALDDEFIKTLGNFKDIEDFRMKLKENIGLEKEAKEKEKQRIKIIEAILENTKIDLPRILIESELDKMLFQVRGDIEASGFKFEDYLKHLNKTEEDMKKEWEKEAEKRAKSELLLRAIALAEDIKVEEKEAQQEVGRLMHVHKDADPMRARAYIENILKNEKVFAILENQ